MKVSDFTVEPVDRKVISSFIEKNHYTHNVNGISHKQCFALYSPDGKFGLPRMIGAIMYGNPSMSNTAKKYSPNNPDRCWELRRLYCIDDTPKNTESYFISRTLKWLKQNTDIEVIVSYSDLQQGHEGVVYKASNFISMGQTPMGLALMVDGKQYHDRTIRNPKPYARTIKRRWEAKQSGKKDDDIYLQKTKPKNIYVYYLNKKLRKNNVL